MKDYYEKATRALQLAELSHGGANYSIILIFIILHQAVLSQKMMDKICNTEFVESKPELKPVIICPDCGGELKYYYSILPYQMIHTDTG